MAKTTRQGFFLVLSLLTAACAVQPADFDDSTLWLPLDRTQSFGLLSNRLGIESSKLQPLDQYLKWRRAELESGKQDREKLERHLTHLDAKKTKLSSEDIVWFATKPDLPFTVAMAGGGKQVHTISVTIPTASNFQEENQNSLDALSDLFEALHPDWPDARNWPLQSLRAAWNIDPSDQEKPQSDPNAVFVRNTLRGITSTTFGVPPDIVVFTVTVRKRCVPVFEQGNPFERIIC